MSARLTAATAALAAALLLSIPAASTAEPAQPGPLTSAIASFAATQSPPPASRPRDSLQNGAIIGAIVGAAALGGFGLFLCYALDDTGNPNCFPRGLVIFAVGAGIGAGAGVGIDALIDRQAVRLRVRF